MFKHLFWSYNKNLRPEFFPWWLCYLSVKIYWARKWITWDHLLWFTRTNPGFPLGGLYPSGKWEILEQLPAQYVPKTVYINQEDFAVSTIQAKLKEADLWFPCIVKPDNGLRGLWIQIFHTSAELDLKLAWYIDENKRRWAWLFQEFVTYPLELWIFYIRKPHEQNGIITWIVEKEFLSIEWDGVSTVEQLVHRHPRAKFHFKLLSDQFASQRNTVLDTWDVLDIVEIWTHSRWSTFLDRSEYVSDALVTLIDDLAKQVDWFYYWRFDIRAESLEWLLDGRFKVMEINPTYGEPTWMYDPDYSFVQQQKILLSHRSRMYEVAKQNKSLGIKAATIEDRKATSKQYNSLV